MIKLDERKIFTGSTTSPAPASFVTRMLMRDLFDVANVLVYIRFMFLLVVKQYLMLPIKQIIVCVT